MDLNHARLPIPPYPHIFSFVTGIRARVTTCGARHLSAAINRLVLCRPLRLSFLAASATGSARSETANSAISAYLVLQQK